MSFFPPNPEIGQIHTIGSNSWIWNGYAWQTIVTLVNSVNGLSGNIEITGGAEIDVTVQDSNIVLSIDPVGIIGDLPVATTASAGIASFDNNTFNVASGGHVSVKTGIIANRIVVLEQSPDFGLGLTGALPGLDGYKLVNVNAKLLDGKSAGINAGQVLVLGESVLYGPGATGALPALDGSALTGVDAKFLRGKTPREITDGGVF